MSIQHRYAQITATGVAVDIRKVGKSDGPFKCLDPKCGLEMIAHKGEVNVHHFAHKPNAANECKLRAGGAGEGESSSHIYFKRFLSGRVRTMLFQRVCVGCQRPTRIHRFPPNVRVALEYPIEVNKRKYVLDVAILHESNPTVVGVLEVRHRHAVPQQKAVDLIEQYGLSVHELATEDLEEYETNNKPEAPIRDLLGDAREHCATCKGGDALEQDPRLSSSGSAAAAPCFKWNSRLFMHKAASAMRPDRKCHTCDSWIHHSAAVAIAVPKYEYKPGKFSFTRFACTHCQKKCPCCRQTILDAAYIEEKKQCTRCDVEVKRVSKCVEDPNADKQTLEACRTSRVLTHSDIHIKLKESLIEAIRKREEADQKKEQQSITACFKRQLEKRKATFAESPSCSSSSPAASVQASTDSAAAPAAAKKLKSNSQITDFFKPRGVKK